MNSKVPTRKEAYSLLTEYNKNESLIKHALAVEGVMRYIARKLDEDEEKWGVIGLIHDLDYEKYPDQHCQKTEDGHAGSRRLYWTKRIGHRLKSPSVLLLHSTISLMV